MMGFKGVPTVAAIDHIRQHVKESRQASKQSTDLEVADLVPLRLQVDGLAQDLHHCEFKEWVGGWMDESVGQSGSRSID